jgi:hypothetical protein
LPPIDTIEVEVLDKDANPIGAKHFYNLPSNTFLNVWLDRPRANKDPVLPLRNAVLPSQTTPRVKTWSDGAIAYMYCGVNDLQHAEQQTVIYSSPYGGGNGFYITPANLWQAAVIFSVRRLVRPTWVNDRDQFLQPTKPLSTEFKNDCLAWMLFNRCNRTAGAKNIEWDGKKWSLVNHFIPFSESDVGSTDRFESDFMLNYLKPLTFSKEAQAVFSTGKTIWRAYFEHDDPKSVRDELKLNRPDVGWFQVRTAIGKRNTNGGYPLVNFDAFNKAYEALTDKLRPMVFDLGFLRP